LPAQTFRKHQIVCKYTVLATIHFFFYEKPSPSKPHWHHLPNWDIIFKFGTVETLSSLLPLPLKRQNIPDAFIVPCYPQNIQFPAPNTPNSERTHPPATSAIVVIYLLVPPTPCSTPPPYYTPPPSHPAPSAYQPPYPLMQKTLFVILTSPGSLAYTLVYTVFWVVGLVPYTLIMYSGLNPSLKA